MHLELRLLHFQAAALVVAFAELMAQDAQRIGEFLGGGGDAARSSSSCATSSSAFADLPAQAFEIRLDLGVLRDGRVDALLVARRCRCGAARSAR